MASGSSGSSMLFFCTGDEGDHVDQAINFQQDTNVVPPAQATNPRKNRRNPPGMLYPDAEVIELSPATLMTTNRFVCEVCDKGFPREQNLQLHRRGHNLPWKLKQSDKDVKRKVYVCPEPSCVNHQHSHALGDLTGIKKHYSRKHGQKKYQCQKCSKMYAVQADLKAHSKNCGSKEYQCNCGTVFSRRDSFITHKAFCDALAQGILIRPPPTLSNIEINSIKRTSNNNNGQMSVCLPELVTQVPSINLTQTQPAIVTGVSQLGHFQTGQSSLINGYKSSPSFFMPSSDEQNQHKYHDDMALYNPNFMENGGNYGNGEGSSLFSGGGIISDLPALVYSPSNTGPMPQLSATGLLQKAALCGSLCSNNSATNLLRNYASSSSSSAGWGMKSENVELFGSGHFGISDSNGHESNINHELLSAFSNRGVGSSLFNAHTGASYHQEESYYAGLDNGSRGYNDGWRTFNNEEQNPPQNAANNIGFQPSTGVAFTRDFLGVGGKMSNINCDEPEITFRGGNFL